MASTYFDHPEDAKQPIARVPLENLFRVLEMYRNDTFSDESRSGVLALESQLSIALVNQKEDDWYFHIKGAVRECLVNTFGKGKAEADATVELQEALRALASDESFDDRKDRFTIAKRFFNQLGNVL
jgi:hypothetical protein